MSITVNENGVLYELSTVTTNENGVLYELDKVHANEGGTLYEIFTKAPKVILTWSRYAYTIGTTLTASEDGLTVTLTGGPGAGVQSSQVKLSGTLKATFNIEFYSAIAGSVNFDIVNADTNVTYKNIKYEGSAASAQTIYKTETLNETLPAGNYILRWSGGANSATGNSSYKCTMTITQLPLT